MKGSDVKYGGKEPLLREDQVSPGQVIIGLFDIIVGALEAGFIDSNTLTIGEFYRIAQNHLKDRYQEQIPNIAERYGQEIAEMAEMACMSKSQP